MIQTRKEALARLLGKVEAGNSAARDIAGAFGAFGPPEEGISWAVYNAMRGSLDAAKALHEAVLPGWIWGRYANGGMWVAKRPHIFRAPPMMEPSLGLLWCDIKVLIAQEPDQ